MPYYCKKPVIIQAEILEKDQIIETLEGPLQGRKGDYLITGIRGEKFIRASPIYFMKHIMK